MRWFSWPWRISDIRADDVPRLIKDVDQTLNFLAKTLINRGEIIRTRPHQASSTWRYRRALKVIKERMIDRQSEGECAARHSCASLFSLKRKCFSNSE